MSQVVRPPLTAPAGSCSTVSTAPSANAVTVSTPLPAPVGPTPLPINQFTLPPIKSGSDYLKTWDSILFWLRSPGFSTGRSDSALITDTTNSLASQYWEGELWMAVQDGSVRYLFDKTGDLYYGCRFEMLAALEANFKPATFSHTFAVLLFLINSKQSEEGIHEFWVCFEGHLHDMSQPADSIAQILQAMLIYGHFILVTKQSLTCLLQNRSTSLSNGNPDPVTDD